MSSSTGFVLVTGATGFIGSHIVSQLLAKNIKVRAVVRSANKLKTIFPDAGSQLDIVELPSLLEDHAEALKGVSAVIHTAAPAFFKGATGEETFKGAYEGTLNIVNQAIASGINKIIVTGSMANLFDSDLKGAFGTQVVTEKDFGAIETEGYKNLIEQDAFFVYQAAKTVSDKKLRDLLRSIPRLTLQFLEYALIGISVLPPMVLGPLVPNFPFSPDINQLGTNCFVHGLITGGPDGPNTNPPVNFGHVVDVRDVAKAHVWRWNALEYRPSQAYDLSTDTFKWKTRLKL
ncbi:hypothetical protein VNI00_017600 [Paramarasmius palmivorus]|uniref:NAD(P)-binding domain-containing protein n=1 Tax=Paramarasmius palmivorus TaxID=297713 RepID=A0AAW0B6Z8_9AGAR